MKKLLFSMLGVLMSFGSLLAADDANQLAQDNSAFAIDLYHQLGAKDGNLFFSPYSISTALAMTYGGARGDTATQMAQALHFSLPAEKVPGAFAALRKELSAAQGEKKVTLTIANSIWPSKQCKLLDDYVGLLKESYDSKPTPLDYSKPDAAREIINTWVEEKTHQKIKDLIGPGILTPDTKLTLVNAIYFYGKWATVFEPDKTVKEKFCLNADKTVDVDMMRQQLFVRYADLDSLQALELPYAGGDLSMLILLPKAKDGLGALETELSTPTLAGWTGRLSRTSVYVSLPKFKLTWGTELLNDKLQALGMKDAFEARADFSGMDGKPHELFIGAVLHKAFIDVKEEGTEAAAATGVVMMRGAMAPSPAALFYADHPFFFLIQDNKTGSILFMGRVTNPNAGGQ
jgi:serpin B